MEKKIESYNASYPAAFYEIGTIYSFYGIRTSKGTPATQECISRYSSVLKELESQQKSNAIQPVRGDSVGSSSGNGGLTRYYAVVVAKTAATIQIMFLNEDNGNESYLTRKYAVSKSCATDGKNWMTPTIKTDISDEQGAKTTGGITIIREKRKTVGGITKADNSYTTVANVGGITHMKNQSFDVSDIYNDLGHHTPKVGGVTRMKK